MQHSVRDEQENDALAVLLRPGLPLLEHNA
jgi:hypothetical protein